MSSLEEEKLFQMVHDFIESESSPPIFSSPSETPPLSRRTQYFILQEILGSNSDAETEVLETVLKHMRDKMEAEKTSSMKKWLVMKLKKDGFDASLCQTSWPTTSGCPAGDYEYIDVIVMEAGEMGMSKRLILDIDFKSQFELARPTSAYKDLTSTLPTIFVGDDQKLKKIISLLCSAAKQSLRERGLHLPPWRTRDYMQSKWLSEFHKKAPLVSSFDRSEDNREAAGRGGGGVNSKFASPNLGKWVPPLVKPKRRGFGGGSGLSSQFSNMSTAECC